MADAFPFASSTQPFLFVFAVTQRDRRSHAIDSWKKQGPMSDPHSPGLPLLGLALPSTAIHRRNESSGSGLQFSSRSMLGSSFVSYILSEEFDRCDDEVEDEPLTPTAACAVLARQLGAFSN